VNYQNVQRKAHYKSPFLACQLSVFSAPTQNRVVKCHTWFSCQNQVLIVCMTQNQLFHTYGPKVFTDNQMSQIKYNFYISNVSKDYDGSQCNGIAEDSITP
jgi:hypothetical protein